MMTAIGNTAGHAEIWYLGQKLIEEDVNIIRLLMKD